ncbi:unnamed protein product [Zymoseptoria tritici ST99CH_3D7]|uniref:Uncharacterized protein n=1 Tax=Zymoseptoria tritici (strain ST99CH_3D7) TaxID=1276538 RepID=A0A1X7S692_ZYMT9|nr:unnamed protein product [Zymoseptoria tritici ST99CH_3D7]
MVQCSATRCVSLWHSTGTQLIARYRLASDSIPSTIDQNLARAHLAIAVAALGHPGVAFRCSEVLDTQFIWICMVIPCTNMRATARSTGGTWAR